MHDPEALQPLLRSQLGLATRAQLIALGLSIQNIATAEAKGWLRQVRRGVYGAADVDGFAMELLAAVLAAGDAAYASHTSAARIWELKQLPAEDKIEVTTVIERHVRLAGVRVHRSGLWHERDVTMVSNIPLTSPERTVCDLSGRLDRTKLGVVVDELLRRRLTTFGRLQACASRLKPAPGRSQKRMLSVLWARGPEADLRESELEDFVYESIRSFGLPLPVPQHEVVVGDRRRRIDLCYPNAMLAIEVQGYEYHGQRERFDDDAMRGNDLQLAGFRVLEFTSSFDDRTIARHVAAALGLPFVPRARPPLTLDTWRLCS